MCERIVAHHQAGALTVQRASQLVAIVSFERTFGSTLVQIACFEDEAYFVDGRGHGKVIDLA